MSQKWFTKIALIFKVAVFSTGFFVTSVSAAPVTTTVDPFTGITSTSTEWLALDNGCSGVLTCLVDLSSYKVRLSGSISRDGRATSHCLTVMYEGDQWAFYAKSNDRAGVALKVSVLDRRIGKSWDTRGVSEVVCVELSKPYLAAQAQSALILQLEGKYSKFVVTVPPNMIAGYLEAVRHWPDVSRVTIRRVVLGIQYQPVNREMLSKMSIDAENGHAVLTVAPSSVAELSGIRVGDVILKIDDEAVTSAENVAELAQNWTAGKPGKLLIHRAGQSINLKVAP